MAKDELPEFKRRNKTLSVSDALSGALDPVLKKRGFAGRDIIAQWRHIAPPPFDQTTLPDKLTWPRHDHSAYLLWLEAMNGKCMGSGETQAPA